MISFAGSASTPTFRLAVPAGNRSATAGSIICPLRRWIGRKQSAGRHGQDLARWRISTIPPQLTRLCRPR
jgi:hypothetical protein